MHALPHNLIKHGMHHLMCGRYPSRPQSCR